MYIYIYIYTSKRTKNYFIRAFINYQLYARNHLQKPPHLYIYS